MDFLDVSVGAWQLTYMLMALIIPIMLCSVVIRLGIRTTKKTIRAARK